MKCSESWRGGFATNERNERGDDEMTIEIEVVKVENRVTFGDLETNDYYTIKSGEIRLKTNVGAWCFDNKFMVDPDNSSYVIRCHPDGTLIEPAGVAKVRADTIKIGQFFISDSGHLSVVIGHGEEQVKTMSTVTLGNEGLSPGWDLPSLMVTPCTITKIIVQEGTAS